MLVATCTFRAVSAFERADEGIAVGKEIDSTRAADRLHFECHACTATELWRSSIVRNSLGFFFNKRTNARRMESALPKPHCTPI